MTIPEGASLALIVYQTPNRRWEIPEWIERIPLADLALKVLIPLGRLFQPIVRQPIPLDLIPISTATLFTAKPLRGFEPSSDLNHLESILRLLRNQTIRIPSLTCLFEALTVYDGSLTATHWKAPEDKTMLSIWSMLSYLGHCRAAFAQTSPHLLNLIEKRLIRALQNDIPIFQTILDYEMTKEQRNYLQLQRIELQIRLFYKKEYENSLEEDEERDPTLMGIEAMANFKECQKLEKFKARRALRHEEMIVLGEKIWQELSDGNEQIRDQVLDTLEVRSYVSEIDRFTARVKVFKEEVDAKVSNASLNQVKRAFQAFYEEEHLTIAIQVLEDFLKIEEPDRNVYIQVLNVLREGLRTVLSDQKLNINTPKSVSNLSALITDLRNFFEKMHKLKVTGTTRTDLEDGLFTELKQLGGHLLKLMKLRQAKIRRLLTPHPQIAPEDAYETLVFRDKAAGATPGAKEFIKENYPRIAEFHARIIEKKELPETLQECFKQLIEAIENLREAIIGLNRAALETRLNQDLSFKLKVQSKVSLCESLLDKSMGHLKKYSFDAEETYAMIEECYFAIRDARNFFTHDLWRENTKGLVNTCHLLVYDCAELMQSLFVAPVAIQPDSLDDHVFHEAAFERLTGDLLLQALERGFKLDAVDNKGRSVLHFIAQDPSYENLNVAHLIIQKGGNIHHADCTQKRAIHVAAESGFLLLVRLLVKAGAVPDVKSRSGTPLELAQRFEHTATAQFLSRVEGMRRCSNAKALLNAVENLDIENVSALSLTGIDVNMDYKGVLPLVALFRKENVENENKQLRIAALLIQGGADVNHQEPCSGETALHAASQYCRSPRVLQFLLQQKPDVNIQDFYGETPLHFAVRNRFAWLKAMVLAGADVNRKDSHGETPLLRLVNYFNPSARAIEYLITHGARVEEENEYGSILHHVAERGGVAAVQFILRAGASPFRLGRGVLYAGQMPHAVARSQLIALQLFEWMNYLHEHLSMEDQQLLSFWL